MNNLPVSISPRENPSDADRILRMVIGAMVNTGTEPVVAFNLVMAPSPAMPSFSERSAHWQKGEKYTLKREAL